MVEKVHPGEGVLMTKIVGKGANRASATANTNRHAQRTALPPRPGQVEAAREVIASVNGKPQYDKLSVAELRAIAKELAISPLPPKKGDLVTEILAEEKRRSEDYFAEKKVDQALAGDAKADAIDAAFEAPSSKPAAGTGATRSDAKAQAFVERTVGLGWKPEMTTDGERTTLTVRRGPESIDLAWENGVFQHPCTYSMNGRTIQLRNASAANQRMAMDAEKAEQETATVAARKVQRTERAAEPKKALRKPLTFTQLSSDEQVLDALHGRKIAWINRVSGAEESDRVPTPKEIRKLSNQPRIEEGPDGRTIVFPGSAGFRSVLVSAIITVR